MNPFHLSEVLKRVTQTVSLRPFVTTNASELATYANQQFALQGQDKVQNMALILKAIGGISALILLVIALLGSILTLGGVLLTAVKVLIVVIFIALITMILLSSLRSRSRRRQEVEDI